MNKLGKRKTNWLLKQGCVFKPCDIYNEDDGLGTEVCTKYGEYVTNKMKRGYPTLYKNSGKDLNLNDFFRLNFKTKEKLD